MSLVPSEEGMGSIEIPIEKIVGGEVVTVATKAIPIVETPAIAAARFDAQYPPAIHQEPDCLGYNRCTYLEVHYHGFECDKTCTECWGLCHPDCPANNSIESKT